MYAIVKSGGKQHKVAVGETFTVEKLVGEPGATFNLPVLLLVDEGAVTTGTELSTATVTAELVEHSKGPKISMIHYKNKTGYKRRQGHRQKNTVLRVTAIEKG